MVGRPRHTDRTFDRYLGSRIRQRRRSLGLTLVQLGPMVGMAFQQLHKYETGRNQISANVLYRIACALDVKVGYFYDGLEAALDYPPRSYCHLEDRRLLFQLLGHVRMIRNKRHRRAIWTVTRLLSDFD
ncbi:MAG: helix-turn-helix domain-containing protein [Geminicoccaceae bacterium]